MAIIAGGSFGALVILFLVILIVVGAIIYIRKGMHLVMCTVTINAWEFCIQVHFQVTDNL